MKRLPWTRDSRDDFELSTGRRFSANRYLVSIARTDDGEFEIGEGYDGHVAVDGVEDCPSGYVEGCEPWTAAERAELADYMIDLWTAFKGKTT